MARILADRQYTLSQFQQREKLGGIAELNVNTIEKINKLAKRVGAPSYQKTPVFKRHYYHNKKTQKKETISDDDWEAIRNFKTTSLEKNHEGLESKIDKIRSYLNKLTQTNYDEISDCIISLIKDIITEKEYDNALEKIGKSIFEIGSLNKFWSSLYAKLYKDLIDNFEFMQDICIKNCDGFNDLFETINFIDPQTNYNLFCEYNKENDKRRALSSFFMYCSTYGIIEQGKIEQIIIHFIKEIEKNIVLENKDSKIDEIVQNLTVMVTADKDYFKTFNQYEFIKEKIVLFSKMKQSDYPSVTRKIIFKFMDLNDELEDD